MSNRKTKSIRVALGAATLGGFGLIATLGSGVANAAPVQSSNGSPVVGQVYVNDNTTDANTIAGFARHADGSLTPLAGSPFAAGGIGTGAGLASQGALQITSDGRYLIAADAGSNQISVLRIHDDGSLALVRGGVVSSGGVLPVSIAVHGDLVYVANAGTGDSNYVGFHLGADGRLQRIAGSTFSLPDGSQPGDVLFNSTGTNLVGTRVATSEIDSFNVNADGTITPAADSPVAAQATGPFGSEFRPTDPSQLFVSNAHAGAGLGSVSAFGAASDGALFAISPTPVANGQTGTCWVEITHDGKYLFSVNTGTGSISRYSIAPDGTLTLLGSTPASSQAGVGAVDARLSPDGHTLFVNESRVDEVGAFAVDGSNLTELTPTSLPAGAAAAGIVSR